MTTIHVTTRFYAGIEKCFDASRSIDLHLQSMAKTKERAIAGRTSGLCEMGDTITWEAVHFGIKQRMTVEITKMDRPVFFEDRMIKGTFKSMRHEHFFEVQDGLTVMTDKFHYEVPFGMAGWLFDAWLLKRYMTRFLLMRNRVIKEVVEK